MSTSKAADFPANNRAPFVRPANPAYRAVWQSYSVNRWRKRSSMHSSSRIRITPAIGVGTSLLREPESQGHDSPSGNLQGSLPGFRRLPGTRIVWTGTRVLRNTGVPCMTSGSRPIACAITSILTRPVGSRASGPGSRLASVRLGLSERDSAFYSNVARSKQNDSSPDKANARAGHIPLVGAYLLNNPQP